MPTSTSTSTDPKNRASGPQNAPDPAVVAIVSSPEYQQILGAVARGWCHRINAGKPMDPDLAVCIAYEVHQLAAVRA
jgi:hypothetical protein